MTQVCHKRCFSTKKLELEKDCITSCYHKYILSINKMKNYTVDLGKTDKSEFVYKIFNPDYDFVNDYIFPQTGSGFYYPNWSFKAINEKIYPITGYNPFKNEWELR